MGEATWRLEVVKGRTAGRSYPVGSPVTILGNALNGVPGIDLSDQEGDSPRRMASQQAVLEASRGGLALRDLDSPGGTFVNRQRILPGQAKPLQPGDIIQLGGVQLRVAEANGKSPPASPPASVQPVGPFLFTLRSGSVCRSWDDFLRVAAQRWADLRDELTSGRLDDWLRASGNGALIVPRATGLSPDELLDTWLSKLPTTLPARPELDVHPARLVVRVTPGGGLIQRSVQVANVGHRLLHVRAAIEPSDVRWIKIAPPFSDGAQSVVEQVELPLNIEVPATLPRPLKATLRIDGDDATKRIEIVLEAKAAEPAVGQEPARAVDFGLFGRLASVPATSRFLALGLGGIALRLVIAVASGSLGAEGLKAADATTPALLGLSLFLGIIAGLAGAVLAARRGGIGELGYGALSAGIAGSALAAVLVALCRGVEPSLGSWASSPVVVALVWGLLGTGLAWLSLRLFPDRTKRGGPAP
jgi:hypothetical protein